MTFVHNMAFDMPVFVDFAYLIRNICYQKDNKVLLFIRFYLWYNHIKTPQNPNFSVYGCIVRILVRSLCYSLHERSKEVYKYG